MTDTLQDKLPSGRWLLAIVAGIALLILVLALAIRGPECGISGDAIISLITRLLLPGSPVGE